MSKKMKKTFNLIEYMEKSFIGKTISNIDECPNLIGKVVNVNFGYSNHEFVIRIKTSDNIDHDVVIDFYERFTID